MVRHALPAALALWSPEIRDRQGPAAGWRITREADLEAAVFPLGRRWWLCPDSSPSGRRSRAPGQDSPAVLGAGAR